MMEGSYEHIQSSTPGAYKIILAGRKGVGKTTLLGMLSSRSANIDDFGAIMDDPTISMVSKGEARRKGRTKLLVDVKGVEVQAEVWDTADMEVHSGSVGVTRSYFRDSDGVILIYKKSDELSITKLPEWANAAREHSKNCIFSLWCNNPTEQFGSGPSTRDTISHVTKSYMIDDSLCFTYTKEDTTNVHLNFQRFMQHIHQKRRGNTARSRGDVITGNDLSKFGRLKRVCKC